MGTIKTLFVLGALGAAVLAILLAVAWNYEPSPPKVTQDGWWGAGERKPETEADRKIVKYKVHVDDQTLVDLKSRLQNARFKSDIEERTFRYGFRTEYMREIVDYWKNKFDWRKQEAILNSFEHFTTKIEGIKVHFIYAKPKSKTVKTVPLLMVHGWPGSVWEFYKILPMLTDASNDVVFEVICPSIPGYGYSEASHKPGFAQSDAARVFGKLMARLGYDKFYVQGGDWGSVIVTVMAHAYPQNVLGIHSNLVNPPNTPRMFIKQFVGAYFPSLIVGDEKEAAKWYPIGARVMEMLVESGYMHIQATKPDTVGMGLNDSPLALGSYMLEKFGVWTNDTYRDLPDGGTTKKFTLDELLTNVMIYWTNANIASSQRFYKEFFLSEETMAWANCACDVPAGVTIFPGELIKPPRVFAEEKFRNLVQYTDMPRGGHFAALEEPRLLADDVTKFVQKVEKLLKQKKIAK